MGGHEKKYTDSHVHFFLWKDITMQNYPGIVNLYKLLIIDSP